jgi:capsular polysaccharide export protein
MRCAGLTGAITWNGQISIRALAVRAAADLGIPMLFAELSPFRGRYFLDHLGVNAASSLQAVQPETLQAYEGEERLFAMLKSNYLGRQPSKNAPREASGLPSSFVFAPLQVPSDTQIMLHGRAVGSHAEFLGILRELVPLLPANMALAVKPHPSSPYREAYLRDTIGKNILVASDYETRDLLERCAAIVTVNSTVGVDGFLFDKPIIALGNAPWIKPALALQGNTASGIAAALANLPKFDRALRMRFLAHWYHAYTWREHEQPEILRRFVENKMTLARAQLHAASMSASHPENRDHNPASLL